MTYLPHVSSAFLRRVQILISNTMPCPEKFAELGSVVDPKDKRNSSIKCMSFTTRTYTLTRVAPTPKCT